VPDLRSYDGFQDVMLLTSDDGGPALVLSFWDSEESLQQAEAALAPHRASAARDALGADTQREVRIYRLAFRASDADAKASPGLTVRECALEGLPALAASGARAEPSNGLEPLTPSLPCAPEPLPWVATGCRSAHLSRFPRPPICDRLPLVAPARLHKRSIL
jgi:heme-degrading monooxygenase HmoA